LDSLVSFVRQSSCQTGSTLRAMNGVYARPHPGPLPQGEGVAARVAQNFAHRHCRRRPSAVRRKTRMTIRVVRVVNNRRMILPLLGVRVGVATDVYALHL